MNDHGQTESSGTGVPTMAKLVEWVMERPAPASSLPGLVNLASVGIVLHAWRNSPLEDAHTSPWSPLSDGEMMRTNAASTRLTREMLATFCTEVLDVSLPMLSSAPTREATLLLEDCDSLDEFDDVDLLIDELLNPLSVAFTRRVLPCGYTVAEATGEFFEDLVEHVATKLDQFAFVAEEFGLREALYLKAAAGDGQDWWLTPAWPESVGALEVVLSDPDHRHWKIGGYPDHNTRPDRCTDIPQLAAALRDGPDRLTAAEAAWCVNTAAIRFARSRVRRDHLRP